jgi:hypothetical protein
MRSRALKQGWKVIATLVALIMVASAPTFAASVPKNSVKSKSIKDGQVKTADLAAGAVTEAKLADGAVTNVKLAEDSVSTNKIDELAVALEHMQQNSVDTDQLNNGAVTSAKIDDFTVTDDDIGINQVTGGFLGNIAIDTIDENNIAANGVNTSEIEDNSIGRADLAVDYVWAKVSANAGGATLLRGHGATAAARPVVGGYTVTFDRDITSCGWVATANDNAAGVAPTLFATVEQDDPAVTNRLRVRLFDAAGTLTDPAAGDGFTVQLMC